MKTFTTLSKLEPGDKVAIISPSSGLPGLFPWVQDLGLKRLREVFNLNFQEYPTTRQMNSPLEARAKDITDAFEDSNIKAVFASIGGDDQIKLIKFLDPQIFIKNPKPFFGYSDNTHLHNFLWKMGIPSYYGGSIMTQFAMQNKMHDLTVKFLKYALFNNGDFNIEVSKEFNDEGLDWSDKHNLLKQRKMEPNDGLFWDGEVPAQGILWGGCVESMIEQLAVGKYLPDIDELDETVLFLETAEDLPDHWIVEFLLTGMGERGWFSKFKAVLVGRPKAWEFDKQNSEQEKNEYQEKQRETVLKTVRQYNKNIPIVQNLDFGHTDPQIVLPMGKTAKIDSKNKKITLSY